MLPNEFLSKAVIDHGIIDVINQCLGKLGYKSNCNLNVIGELDT